MTASILCTGHVAAHRGAATTTPHRHAHHTAPHCTTPHHWSTPVLVNTDYHGSNFTLLQAHSSHTSSHSNAFPIHKPTPPAHTTGAHNRHTPQAHTSGTQHTTAHYTLPPQYKGYPHDSVYISFSFCSHGDRACALL